jgi:hypothetical protein
MDAVIPGAHLDTSPAWNGVATSSSPFQSHSQGDEDIAAPIPFPGTGDWKLPLKAACPHAAGGKGCAGWGHPAFKGAHLDTAPAWNGVACDGCLRFRRGSL